LTFSQKEKGPEANINYSAFSPSALGSDDAAAPSAAGAPAAGASAAGASASSPPHFFFFLPAAAGASFSRGMNFFLGLGNSKASPLGFWAVPPAAVIFSWADLLYQPAIT